MHIYIVNYYIVILTFCSTCMWSGQEIIIIFHKEQDPKTNESKEIEWENEHYNYMQPINHRLVIATSNIIWFNYNHRHVMIMHESKYKQNNLHIYIYVSMTNSSNTYYSMIGTIQLPSFIHTIHSFIYISHLHTSIYHTYEIQTIDICRNRHDWIWERLKQHTYKHLQCLFS